MSKMLWIIGLCGIGTFALRWLPLWRARQRQSASTAPSLLHKLLAGVGPAAISALFVVSAAGLVTEAARPSQALMVVIALACTAISRWLLKGGVAVPTLLGALAYGLLSHWSA